MPTHCFVVKFRIEFILDTFKDSVSNESREGQVLRLRIRSNQTLVFFVEFKRYRSHTIDLLNGTLYYKMEMFM